MPDVTASMVKELRERTQAGMNDCKNALVETAGDMEKAVDVILKKGIVKAAARAGRVATEGEIATWLAPDAKRGVMVEVNCQTDFVSRGDDFKAFVRGVLEVTSSAPEGADLGAQPYAGGPKTVEQVRAELVSKTGENCVVRRWGSLNPSSTDLRHFVDNVAMQVAAMNPTVVRKEDLTKAQVDKQNEIFAAQLKEEGKPEQAWPKILDGKVSKWLTEVTLLGQDNVWDPAAGTIEKIRLELGKKLGGEVKIRAFLRYSLGEGIERKQEDLAAEVAKMAGG